MVDQSDYSALDKPEVLPFFFYPRKGLSSPPPGARDHIVSVDNDVSIACRFYFNGFRSPSILSFHGFSEIASDYDHVAPIYHNLGINLFVADYRGYGCSGGTPTFSNMVADAHHLFEAFQQLLLGDGHTGNVFLMGRSLGSVPAIELAACYEERIAGLILEGAVASMVKLVTVMGFAQDFLGIRDLAFPNIYKIRAVRAPILFLHGESDTLIPLADTQELFDNAATEDKRIVVVPEADHNDMISLGADLYFGAIRDFIFSR